MAPPLLRWGFHVMMEPVTLSGTFDTRIAAKGMCARCRTEHDSMVGYAIPYAKRLLKTLTSSKRIDFHLPEDKADPKLSTDYLWGDARGQMFGVLVCRDRAGRTGVLKAFSGQYNGIWDVDGWVPPLVDVDMLQQISFGAERFIKRLGRQIDDLPTHSLRRKELLNRRKAVSQALMKDIHGLYRIPSLCGKTLPLPEAVYGDNGIPTGTGDCCAPKLLGFAANHSLTPLGLAEFFVGRVNKSKTKRHGGMYTSCKEKCSRILGHMLCGAPTS